MTLAQYLHCDPNSYRKSENIFSNQKKYIQSTVCWLHCWLLDVLLKGDILQQQKGCLRGRSKTVKRAPVNVVDRKSWLQETSPHFVDWKGTTESTLSCLIYDTGIQEDTFAAFYSTMGHRGGGGSCWTKKDILINCVVKQFFKQHSVCHFQCNSSVTL